MLEPDPAGPAGRLVAGRYRLDRPLGGGAMGTVWRGHDTRLGRDVAVKEVVLPPSLPDGERRVLRERTFREARVAARLHHPCAVEVYDVVEAGDHPCLVMELVEARTLAEVVRDGGPLAPREAARVGLALLGALDAAHRAGVLHRDVKPGNVLVTHAGRVVLSDFGIATSVDDVRVTSTGLLLGSPAYMAPERARGREPGPPSDLWSLGATLYACVEGRPPFEGDDPLTVLTKVVAEPPPPPLSAGPLAPVLLGLLDKDPERRLDAAGARALLEGAARQEAAGLPRAPVPRHSGSAGSRAGPTDPTVATVAIGAAPVRARGGRSGGTRSNGAASGGTRSNGAASGGTGSGREEGGSQPARERGRTGRDRLPAGSAAPAPPAPRPRRGGAALRALAVGLALLAAAAGGFALQREVPALQVPVTAPPAPDALSGCDDGGLPPAGVRNALPDGTHLACCTSRGPLV
jgi:hypothetical protein